jgi:hypothetical protein
MVAEHPAGEPAGKSARAHGLMKPPSYLVQILLPKETGSGLASLSEELTDSWRRDQLWVRAYGPAAGISSGDNIAIIEVMTDELDLPYWKTPPEA